MFYKFVIFSLCFAVIHTKTLVQKKEHNEVNEINGLEDEKPDTLAPNKKKTDKHETVERVLSEIFLKQIENHPEQSEQFKDLEDLLRRNMADREIEENTKIEPEVGFGGNPPQGDNNPRVVFGNMTTYVNKAINQIRHKLEHNGQRIYANNEPYTIIISGMPRTSIIFKLKYIEGANSLTTQGTSMGLHYFNAVYTYNQFKFGKIKYFYEVQIRPMNLFTIRKSITIILEDARVYMPTTFEKNLLNVDQYEYVKPLVTVECADNMFINYILNDIIIDKYYPQTKDKLAQIAARDSKLLLDSHLKQAQ